ncbi:MAG: glycosyltransferase family 2 protein [Alistipes sp.]|jgi:glycosyltransferase involved in cell wall biosynthesis|nr:glycosyltransferase family 2 protein [Alistipes sp.]
MINYSIIIPHKNIPDLLERCLASIPRRDDVQIVIVDDSSEERLVDFARFPGTGRSGVDIVFHKSPIGGVGGSGMARNVGLGVATGKWLIFADADDFFHTDAIAAAMDKHVDSEADMIFFRHDSVDSATLAPVEINTARNRSLADFDRVKSGADDRARIAADDRVRFRITVPWARFIRREIVVSHGIRFDEVRFSNSELFSIKVGYFAEKIVSDPAVVYCNVRREGSLIHEGRRDWEAMSQRFDVDYRAALFAASVGKGALWEGVVADRWRELSLLHRRGARKLLTRLREVCSARRVRQARFEEAARRALSVFFKRHRKRNILRNHA